MPSKTGRRPRRPERTARRRPDHDAADAMRPGMVVVPRPGSEIVGADPFTELVVIAVNRLLGTVDLALLGGADDGSWWAGVPADQVANAR